MFEKILLPIIEGVTSKQTVRETVQIALRHKSHIIILFTKEKIKCQKTDMELSKIDSSWCNKTQEVLIQEKIPYELIKQTGETTLLISNTAYLNNVDLIIMNAKELNLKNDPQNIASLVIGKTTCPLLLVP